MVATSRRSAVVTALFLTLLPLGVAAQTFAELAASVQEYVAVSEPVIALSNVRVVDGTGSPPREGQTVVIADGRITAVGDAGTIRVPAGARVVDLSGHTVIPGLIGLHNHTFYTTRGRSVQLQFSAPRLYLGSGVTTIRTTGGTSPYHEINMKRAIEAGRSPGPRMHLTGPYLTGIGGGETMAQVETPEDARRIVGYWADEGVTWYKAYTQISREALQAAIEEAHRRGLKFTGHLCSVSFREAVALGIDNLEHGLFTNSDYAADKQPSECPSSMRNSLLEVDMEGTNVRRTIDEMVRNDVALTSTLAVYELSFPDRPPLEQRVLDALAPEAREEYLSVRRQISEQAGESTQPELFRRAQRFEKMFADAGGLLASGVDPTGNGGALPGFGDQRNYELLIEAGFAPVEAIRIMTLNGARVLGEEANLGSIETGKLADLIVISGDPIADPAAIRNVRWVFKEGVGFDASKLITAVAGQVGVR
jgi:imidazolonepropionase-like amidohydrolase